MNQNAAALMHGYLDGSLDAADFERLQSLLRNDAEARRMLRSLATVDAKLQELAAVNPATLALLSSSPQPGQAVQLTPRSSFWRRPLVRWAATGAVAAILLVVFFVSGVQRGRFNVLAAVAEAQRTAQLPKLRQYAVSLARENVDVKSEVPPLFQRGTLRSKGSERFIFQTTSKGILPVEIHVHAGRDERSYWAYVAPFQRVMRSQDLPRLNDAFPGFTLAYMELGPIIAGLSADFDIADLGAEPQSNLRHLQGTPKAARGGPIRLLDFWIDGNSEIMRLVVQVRTPREGDVRITFEREVADFENDDVFQATHYAPAGTAEVDVNAAPLRNLLEKRIQRKTPGDVR